MSADIVDTIVAKQCRDVWIVTRNSDLTEGRGYQMVHAVCELEATARRLAHRCDVQGSDGTVYRVQALLLEVPKNGRYGAVAWYAPTHITQPTPADREAERGLVLAREKVEAREKAIQKAIAAGLSNEEIALLRGGA